MSIKRILFVQCLNCVSEPCACEQISGTVHCKKKSVKFTVKNWQLWLPEFSRKKYGNNILGFTVLT